MTMDSKRAKKNFVSKIHLITLDYNNALKSFYNSLAKYGKLIFQLPCWKKSSILSLPYFGADKVEICFSTFDSFCKFFSHRPQRNISVLHNFV